MPITRRQQLLIKVETSEGVSSNPGASDAIQIFDPNYSDTVEQLERTPAGGSLSRSFSSIGRTTRQVTGTTDMRGSGDVTLPVDPPEWGKLLLASGYRVATLKKLTLGTVTGTGFQVGEIVQQSGGTIRGVVVGVFTAGGALVDRLTTSGGHLAIVVLAGTFTAAATTAESSGSTSTASAVADYEGIAYQPTSQKQVQVSTGAWSSGTPAVGEALDVEVSGAKVGGVLVIADNGSFTSMNVVLLWGQMLNGNTLRTANGASTATISADPVQILTPSLTVRHNFDGRRRDMLGARCDFQAQADVGQPLSFNWTIQGDLGPAIDTQPVTTTGLSAVRAPRLLGAICAYGRGANLYRLTTKRIGVANNGAVNPNLDANRAGGSTGSNITDRDPTVTFQTDMVHGAFDWEAIRDNGTAIRAAHLLGTTKGQIVGVVVPNGQVTEVTPADANGIGAFDIALKARSVVESGDDELYLVQL